MKRKLPKTYIITDIIHGRLSRTLLLGVLFVIYMSLFIGTGIVAFFKEYNLNAQVLGVKQNLEVIISDNKLDSAAKKDIIKVITTGLKSSVEGKLKRNELAGQAFNVVLGAIIGFLSAAVTYMFTPNQSPEKDDDDGQDPQGPADSDPNSPVTEESTL